MIIVNAQNVRKYHAAHLVLDGAAFQIQDGEKVGLIGRNGSGKSTLLRLLSGRDSADEGMLTVRRDARIGYLPQIPAAYDSMTVYEVLASGFGSLMKAKEELAGLESRMADPDLAPSALERLLVRYSEVQELFEQGEATTSIPSSIRSRAACRSTAAGTGRRSGACRAGRRPGSCWLPSW